MVGWPNEEMYSFQLMQLMKKNNSTPMETTVEEKYIHKKMSEGAEKTKCRSSACIYKVPRELRGVKRSAYTPHLVSIGPFHSKDRYLKKRSHHIKLSYANFLLFGRIPNSGESDKSGGVLKECLNQMKVLVDEAKKCYSETVDDRLNEEMLLIDGCFILEYLLRYAEVQQICESNGCSNINANDKSHPSCKKNGDPIFGSVPTLLAVQDDLLLLENQLPFVVLRKLFSLTVEKIKPRPLDSLCDYVNQFIPTLDRVHSKTERTKSGSVSEFSIRISGDEMVDSVGEGKKQLTVLHILHFIHETYRLPRDPSSPSQGKDHHQKVSSSKFMYSASDLDYAGVKFAAPSPPTEEAPNNNIFNVRFKEVEGTFHCFRRGRFEIPTLCIDDSAERLLRNLIAFEQCHPGVEYYVTSYAFLMDRLINTAKDVEVLQKAGVIRNYLGANEEASDIFNKLCKEVELGEFSYAQTCKDAAEYSQRFWPEVTTYLRYTYFSKPWTFVAFCIAFIAFVATLGNFALNLSRNPPNK